MNESAKIELRCECSIPYQSELTDAVKDIVGHSDRKVPHDVAPMEKSAIDDALRNKPLYVNVGYKMPVKSIKPLIIKGLQSLFGKDVVTVMKIAENEFTLILL